MAPSPRDIRRFQSLLRSALDRRTPQEERKIAFRHAADLYAEHNELVAAVGEHMPPPAPSPAERGAAWVRQAKTWAQHAPDVVQDASSIVRNLRRAASVYEEVPMARLRKFRETLDKIETAGASFDRDDEGTTVAVVVFVDFDDAENLITQAEDNDRTRDKIVAKLGAIVFDTLDEAVSDGTAGEWPDEWEALGS